LFFLLGTAFTLAFSKVEMFGTLGHYGMLFSYFIGLAGMVIGSLWAGLDLLLEMLLHPKETH
jgi:hypothetical protein